MRTVDKRFKVIAYDERNRRVRLPRVYFAAERDIAEAERIRVLQRTGIDRAQVVQVGGPR